MKRLTVLTLIAALCLSCSKNHAPIIDSLIAEPDSVYPGDTVTLSCSSTDPDGDGLMTMWYCDFGTWVQENQSWGEPVEWIAPKNSGVYYITLKINDLAIEVEDSVRVTVLDTIGTFVDTRDGHKYKWVKIGGQIWMAENLGYLPEVSKPGTGSEEEAHYYVYDYNDTIVTTAKESEYYITYGALYNWEAALAACPPGWHLSSDQEWMILEAYLGMHPVEIQRAGIRRTTGNVDIKLKSVTGWNNDANGDNRTGFSALPAGQRCSHGPFALLGGDTFYWTSTAQSRQWSFYRYLGSVPGIMREYYLRRQGFSVRCVKDVR